MSATATILFRTVITLAGKYSITRRDTTHSDGCAASRCRDAFVSGALGVKSYQGFNFQTVATNITGLLPSGSKGVNHGMAPPNIYATLFVYRLATGIATDGVTVLLTVTVES